MLIVCPHCLTANRVPDARQLDQPGCGHCHQPLLPDHPVHLKDTEVAALLDRTQCPVVMDFWAPWCGPCQAFSPHFEAAARTMAGQVLFAKINSDDNPKASVRFRVRSIPTLVLVQQGREIQRHSGAMSTATLLHWLQAGLRHPA